MAVKRLRGANAHFRDFVGQHDHGVADLDLRMADRFIARAGYAKEFFRIECLLVELDGFYSAAHVQVRRHCVIPLGYRLYGLCHINLLFLESKGNITLPHAVPSSFVVGHKTDFLAPAIRAFMPDFGPTAHWSLLLNANREIR